MKQIILLFTICIGPFVFSQNIVNTLPSTYQNVKNSFSIVDDETQEYYIILQTSNSVKAYQYSKEHELKNNIQLFNLEKEYDVLIGAFTSKGILKLIFSKKYKAFNTLSLNFNNNTTTLGEIDMKVKGKILTVLQKKENIYLLSTLAKGNSLDIYSIDASLNNQKHSLAFDKDTFKDFNGRPVYFNDLTRVLTGMDYIRPSIAIIKDENPNSLLSNANPTKLYTYSNKNKITMTLDKYSSKTYILDIDLNTYTYKSTSIEKPTFDTGFGTRSNSLLFEDKIFQITANNDALKFLVKSYPGRKTLQEYELIKGETITFKNTPIHLKGGSLEASRILDNSSQFLRKVTVDYPAIALRNNEIGYTITFGTEIMLKQIDTGTIALALGGGLIGGIIGAAISGNADKFDNYNMPTRKIKFEGLFDEDFNHIDGEVKEKATKMIPSYFTDNNDIRAISLFEINQDLYIGYFHKIQSKYYISGLD